MPGRTAPAALRFGAVPYTIDGVMLLQLPPEASQKLPSRGQVAVRGTIDGREFRTVVEPDGRGGHWLRLGHGPELAGRVSAGAIATIEMEPSRDWPEPIVPHDLEAALSAAPQSVREVWQEITPMARWEWVRWVNATANPDTRRRRVEVSVSKMISGKRRPCCFDLTACTDPELARNGKLREPREAVSPRPAAS